MCPLRFFIEQKNRPLFLISQEEKPPQNKKLVHRLFVHSFFISFTAIIDFNKDKNKKLVYRQMS